MRGHARLTLAALVVVIGPLISACDSLDKFTGMFDTKKKLAGERKPVFPEGVPGATAGVPPDLYKGYREPDQATGAMDPAKLAAQAAAADKPKPKPKPKDAKADPKPAKPASATSAAAPAPPAPPQRTAAQPSQVPFDPYGSQPAAAPPAPPAPQAAAPAPWPGQPPAAQPQAGWPGTR